MCGMFFAVQSLFADIKTWTSLAGDGLYANPLNWSGNSLPTSADELLFDNSTMATSYTVTLPDEAITVRSIIISPSGGQTIKLVLPPTNLNTPAVIITGGSYSLRIENGGIFQNSSGLTSGSSVSVADSIKINNGGRYIHNTRSSHAMSIVQLLSKAPGTETGIFEFDTPGTQSYTVSLSNRTYGTLVLNAASAVSGTRTYTDLGSNQLTIRGDFQIGIGVTLKSNLATDKGNILVNGNFIQNGGELNLASGPDNTILKIKGDIIQAAGSVITETSTGHPAIELNGSVLQHISMQGTISNSVIFRMNNPAGAVLQAPLSLSHQLELVKGNITTSAVNLLTLQPGANIFVDSTTENASFISGPLRKEGLFATDYFLFPIGKPNEFRWLELKNASGNFLVEYISANAQSLSSNYGPGIDHISTHGYWSVAADASPVASAHIELSFSDAGASGITDMATLRASQLNAGMWADRNNSATTGSPGSSGSVISELINPIAPSANYFVLASSVSNENPLPLILLSFSGVQENHFVKLNWNVNSDNDIDYFEIWSADHNDEYNKLNEVPAILYQSTYSFRDSRMLNGSMYYKLRVVMKDGSYFFSKIILINKDISSLSSLIIAPSPAYDYATVFVQVKEKSKLQFIITGTEGKIAGSFYFPADRGMNTVPINLDQLASGAYVLSCFDGKGKISSVRFIKL